MGGEVQIDRRLPAELATQTGSARDVQSQSDQSGYYGISMLQPPVWEGHYIGPYFFLGGLSAGAFLLARAAEWLGGRERREVSRAGSTVALLAALPCAPLLIKDLGDPKRFHHMLRVFKPQSPMNLGSWTLTGYGAIAAAAALREWRRNRSRRAAGGALDRSLGVVCDAAGVPLALIMTCYTGVLLSGTATPVWSRNLWLAPLFAASAMANGAAAIGLALQMQDSSPNHRSKQALENLELIANAAELILLGQYLRSLGPLGKPLTSGRQAKWMLASVGGIIAGQVLKRAVPQGRSNHWGKVAGGIVALASGLALKYGILEAGKTSAADPDAAQLASSAGSGRKAIPQVSRKFPRPAQAQMH